jgi:hypothetical protein
MLELPIVALLVALSAGLAEQPAAGLQVVVLQGEDAINIIQQKTAVGPIVEVRDRNGLPVAGATVTFTIEGGKLATFSGGTSTLTVATNAVGRAAVAAIDPISAGSFQIQVQAAFQGQTVAATIAQSNVMTLAEAAATASTAGSSAAAGSAAGGAAGGGGVSATTIGIVGAAVGGGALVATQVGGDSAAAPTGPTSTTRTLSGLISGTLIHNYSDPRNSAVCTIHHVLRADATVTLTIQSDAVTGGSFQWTGTDASLGGGTCVLTQTNTGSFTGSAQLTGPAGALGFRTVSNFNTQTLQGEPSNVEQVAGFTGAFDGTSLTGSFTFERTIVTPSVSQRTVGQITIPVTLR